jgi:hypothetical protein
MGPQPLAKGFGLAGGFGMTAGIGLGPIIILFIRHSVIAFAFCVLMVNLSIIR